MDSEVKKLAPLFLGLRGVKNVREGGKQFLMRGHCLGLIQKLTFDQGLEDGEGVSHIVL